MKHELASEVAKHIQDDRLGAFFYKAPEVLASYLAESLNLSEERAKIVAQHICDDRKGADYYQDFELLKKYIFAQIS